MSDGVWRWWDHRGQIIEAPAGTTTCYGRFDRLNHALFAANTAFLVQAITKCGLRAGELPGRGDVDCPECLEIMREDSAPDPTG